MVVRSSSDRHDRSPSDAITPDRLDNLPHGRLHGGAPRFGRSERGDDMDELRVENGDITLRVEVAGDGPAVLCVHGWPELAHSWRHQVAHLASRGYRAAALDVRGYGGSSTPPEIERYRLKELASDVA